MGIVSSKKRLATIIATTLEQAGIAVKILTVGFNEDSANIPQMSKQILIRHLGNTYEQLGTKFRIQRFRVELTLKDLRSDDPIQNVVDLIEMALIDSRFYGRPLDSLESSNEGFDDGIWTYYITVALSEPVGTIGDPLDPNEHCILDDREITEITVSIHPSYSHPLG